MRRSDACAAPMPGTLRPRRTRLLVLLALICWQFEMQAAQVERATRDAAQGRLQGPADAIEFDSSFLQGGSAMDLSRFAHGNIVPAGSYRADIFVNGSMLQRAELRFAAVPGKPDAQPCLDRPLLQRAGVDVSRLAEAADADAPGCLHIDQAVPGARASFDLNRLRLDLSIPQAMLLRTPRGYVGPEQWDAGAPVALLGYNFSTSRSQTPWSSSHSQSYLGIAGGLNYGRWYFRHNGSLSLGRGGQRSYQGINTYVQRDLVDWSSRLLIGETYTDGELMDSTAFRGVRLHTDDRMLPESQRGYAPVVRGVANSNARVSILQNGVKLLETTVAPGSFVINDLYPTGYGGDLEVRITEADGSERRFSIPYAAVPLSLREGAHRYSLTAGTARNLQHTAPPFVQGSYQYGFSNTLTGYGGASLAQGYVSATAGAALSTQWGAVGLDLTHASTRIAREGRYAGQSLRASYSRSFADSGTNVALAAYRYSTNGFFTLNDAMRARDQSRAGLASTQLQRLRNRLSLTMSQQLGERLGHLSAATSVSQYWKQQGSNAEFTIGYSNAFGRIPYNLSASRQRDAMGRASNMLYVGLSIPLETERPATISASASRNSRGAMQAHASASGLLDDENRLAYGISTSYGNARSGAGTNGSASLSYSASQAHLQAGVSAGNGYRQLSAGASGAIVAHPGGITLSQPVSETFGIVEAKHAEGASVGNVVGVKVDGRGYAIVPHLTAYRMNEISIDPKGISTDVELHNTSEHVAPLAGAVPLIVFKTRYSRSAVVRARLQDGTPLPFGAMVSDQEGKDLGVVGQAGKLLLRGLSDQGRLQAHWTDSTGEPATCSLAYALEPQKPAPGYQPPQRLDLSCSAPDGIQFAAASTAPASASTSAAPQKSPAQPSRDPAAGKPHLAGLRLSLRLSALPVPEKTSQQQAPQQTAPAEQAQRVSSLADAPRRALKIERKFNIDRT